MLDEKDCPREDRLLKIHYRFPVAELPHQEAIEKMVNGKDGIDLNVIKDYLDWTPKDNQLVVYTGYGYCDLTIPKKYDCLIDFQNPIKSKPVTAQVIFAIWNGLLPLETIEHGHKTICVIEFQNGIPNELTQIVGMDEWTNAKTNLNFVLCDRNDVELITRKLETGG